MRPLAEVWEHYDTRQKVGKKEAKCKYCGTIYRNALATRLREHINHKCKYCPQSLKRMALNTSQASLRKRRNTNESNESLGGNSQTTMLATVSPSNANVDETLSTLRYACQARSIVNYAHVNECPHERIIRELREEVEKLKSLRQGVEHRQKLAPPRRLLQDEDPRNKEIEELKEELKKCKEELQTAQNTLRSLPGCQNSYDSEFQEEEQPLCCLPFLVRIATDSVHFAAAHHFLQEGVTIIGRTGSDPVSHLALEGSTIQPNHCTIENKDGRLVLMSNQDADLFVNNKRPKETQELHDGDWLAIGGIHHFRVFKRESSHGNHIHHHSQDISDEKKHLLKTQNERMHEELKLLKGLERETRRNAENKEATYKQQIELLTLSAQNYKRTLEVEQTKWKELEQKMLQLENLYQRQRQHCQEILNHPCEHEIVSSYKSNMLEELEHILLNETPKDFEEIEVKVEETSDHYEDASEYEQMAYNDDDVADFHTSWNERDKPEINQQYTQDMVTAHSSKQQSHSQAETMSDFAKEIKRLLGHTEQILDKLVHSAEMEESNERSATVDVLSTVAEQLREVLVSVMLPTKSNLQSANNKRTLKTVRFDLPASQHGSP